MKFLNIAKIVFGFVLISSCQKASDGYAPAPGAVLPSLSELAISPTAITLAVTNVYTFTASGGRAPYSYSIFTGSGSVGSTTGSFTAPGAIGSTVIRVTDADGRVADAAVTINSALQISPTNPSLSINGSQTFSYSGGVSPITFSRVSGTGTINANTGVYQAPATPGSATIRATDARGNTSQTTVNTYGALGISPTSITLAVNNMTTFSAAGGASPYSFAVTSGSGVINAATGVYTAPALAGVATVQVTDSLGGTANASITINDALAISPTSQTTLINSMIDFADSGGVPPMTYSIVSGTGSINASTGEFTAPNANDNVVVRVTDDYGNTADANVTVTTTLTISPASKTMAVNNLQTFSAVGGTGPFTFSRVSGTGAVNAATGVYTAPAASGVAVIRVTDSLGATADANVTVNPALAISPVTQTMGINGTLNFSASGGVVPYSYAIQSGTGSINAATGQFTAPGAPDTTIVRVSDSNGNTTDSTVTVTSGLSISPASTTLAVGNSVTFAGANGAVPYTYSIFSGGGTINAATGFYTAPGAAGAATVRVTDNLGATADATVTINAALAITPATKTLAVNNTFTFSATGGVSPYTYTVFSGGGAINATTGLYTSPAAAGAATVRVTDGLGNTSDSAVTINAALAISPTTGTIAHTGTQAYSSTGGVGPFTYSITSGPGSINSGTGLYTAASAGTIGIRVTDSLSNTSDATLTVTGPLTVTPVTAYAVTGSTLSLSPAGGLPPYTFSQIAGGGTLDTVTGEWVAPATTGSATLRTTDTTVPTAQTADTTITIYDPLTLSPLSITIAASGTQTFTATGGYGARTFSVSGAGTINSATGFYTASAVAGTDFVSVSDTIGNIVTAEVIVVSQLSITPTTLKLPVFSTKTFSAVLGAAPYVYSVTLGTGVVNSGTGFYTAPSIAGAGTVRVTDNITNTADAAVTHIEPTYIASGANHMCVLYNEGSVKCFGDGSAGQLGNGSTSDLGDVGTELGGDLPFVNLGTGVTATALSAGIAHTCAIVTGGAVKCWGQNTYGQLGIGSTLNKGDGANEMGDNLVSVNLGTGRTATKIYAIGYSTCATLDNNVTKCWGRNNSGQLGLDDMVNRGTAGSQMGDTLAAINLGAGRTATMLTGGDGHICAVLDNATAKCWGNNRYGQLGTGDELNKGDAAGEMAALAAINLGTGRTALKIAAGANHTCVIRDNGTTVCFGRNNKGQLGRNENSQKYGGGSPAEMGNGLMTVPFTTYTAAELQLGNQHGCAINASGAVRCWGSGILGQNGNQSPNDIGDGNNELQGVVNVNLGTGIVASSLAVGYSHACVITTTKRIKCWGQALNGALLNGTTTPNIGDGVGEMGDSLPWTNH